MTRLTHFDDAGHAAMVDVSDKDETARTAIAGAVGGCGLGRILRVAYRGPLEVEPGQAREQSGVGAVDPAGGELVEQARSAHVGRGALAANKWRRG